MVSLILISLLTNFIILPLVTMPTSKKKKLRRLCLILVEKQLQQIDLDNNNLLTRILPNPYKKTIGRKCYKCKEWGYALAECRKNAMCQGEEKLVGVHHAKSHDDQKNNLLEDVVNSSNKDDDQQVSYIIRRLMLST